MAKKLLNSPWFYFILSLAHQCLVILPGEFPVLFPDSGSYVGSNAQRTPLYPFLLSAFGSHEVTAAAQILFFALSAAAFFVITKMVINKLDLPKKNIFIWIGSLYFATNFELLQFAPAILTESFGISFFIFYFLSALKWEESRYDSKFYFFLVFFFFPVLLFLLRPSFILVPAAISFFFVLKLWHQKKTKLSALALSGLIFYLASTQVYAYWNSPRLGHVGISDIAQHQVFANYMARGILMEEAAKPEASPGLKSFAEAYTQMDPELRLSQYSLFEKWHELYPDKDLYSELIPVNKELLSKRPLGYLMYSLRNMSVLIDGRASFNYYPTIKERSLPSKIYFGVQFILDNLFFVVWFTALFYFLATIKRRALFSTENFIFLTVATQFFTIGFLGYSELRRQAIGVASIQMLFVLVMWAHLLKNRWAKAESP